MSNQQQSLCSDSNFWKKARKLFDEEIAIKIKDNLWFWVCKGRHFAKSEAIFKSASDTEQDLITFLKNYEGLRNG